MPRGWPKFIVDHSKIRINNTILAQKQSYKGILEIWVKSQVHYYVFRAKICTRHTTKHRESKRKLRFELDSVGIFNPKKATKV